MARAIGRSHDVDELCEIALDALAEGLDVERSAILLADGEGVMRFRSHRGLSEAYRSAVEGHNPWPTGTVDPQPIIVSDTRQAPSLSAFLPAFAAENIGALVFVPLTSHDRVLGKFMLYYRHAHTPSEADVQLAALIAAQIGFAVELTQFGSQARRVLSHDLRTPLNTILGWVRILENGPTPEKLGQALDVISRNVLLQARMIDEALRS
jgi:GAF domain-containing protein